MNGIPRQTRIRRRDIAAERAVSKLKKHDVFKDLPRTVLKGYATLYLLSGEVRTALYRNGLISQNGVWSAGIDILRRLKDSERQYLQLMLDMRREPGVKSNAPRAADWLDELTTARPVNDSGGSTSEGVTDDSD
jgi:hypothetical protein